MILYILNAVLPRSMNVSSHQISTSVSYVIIIHNNNVHDILITFNVDPDGECDIIGSVIDSRDTHFKGFTFYNTVMIVSQFYICNRLSGSVGWYAHACILISIHLYMHIYNYVQ